MSGRGRIPIGGLILEYPMSLGTYDKYADAQKAVDYLSDHDFPVQNCMIVGTDLKQVERVTGRAAGGFGVDRLYRAAFAAPLNAVARDLGRGAERANELAIDGLAALVGRGGDRMRRLQAGPVRGYEALLLTGAVILLAFWSLR
jgi:hypothetical protein